jgi:hypothetical protein
MLRYKNSLLERILIEKGELEMMADHGDSTDSTTGVDVQAELRMKGSPQLGPMKTQPPVTSHALPIQRAMMNRQQATRSTTGVPLPPPVNSIMSTGHENAYSHTSPYPRNPSQTPSPSTSRSSAFAMQGSLSSPTSNYPAQQMHQQPRPPLRPPHRNSIGQHSSHPQSTSGATAARPISIPGKPSPCTDFVPPWTAGEHRLLLW